MAENWSIMLNVFLLLGVIVAIGRMLWLKRDRMQRVLSGSGVMMTAPMSSTASQDDIIAVRKVSTIPSGYAAKSKIANNTSQCSDKVSDKGSETILVFLSAPQGRQFLGYELLQAALAVGLRFGDGHLFHRHPHRNGQGPILFSLAAATTSGVFDLQAIGAFRTRGLCLFMQVSGNAQVDAERFSMMMTTAKQLCEALDAEILDEDRVRFSESSLTRYHQRLNILNRV